VPWYLKQHLFIFLKQRKHLTAAHCESGIDSRFLCRRIHIWPFENKFCSSLYNRPSSLLTEDPFSFIQCK
jgi:hypothetical protein